MYPEKKGGSHKMARPQQNWGLLTLLTRWASIWTMPNTASPKSEPPCGRAVYTPVRATILGHPPQKTAPRGVMHWRYCRYWDTAVLHQAMDTVSPINSLRPSDVIWRCRSGSTLAQVMACCLMAPSHYLNQSWLIISEVQVTFILGQFHNRCLNHQSLKSV